MIVTSPTRSVESPKIAPRTPAVVPSTPTRPTRSFSRRGTEKNRGAGGECGREVWRRSTSGITSIAGSSGRTASCTGAGSEARRAGRLSGCASSGSFEASRTRLRPWSFARYTARSAWCTSSFMSSPSRGKLAMPIEIVARIGSLEVSTSNWRAATARRMRSAISYAWSGGVSGRRIENSSPPKRAGTS